MPLTDVAIRRAAPRSKPYKLFDSDGLFILVNPSGGKWWRLKYRFAGKEKLLSLGTYPEVALSDARRRRDAERRKLADKIDPATARKAAKASWIGNRANSFEVIAREWIGTRSASWEESNTKKTTRRLEVDVFPWLGHKPVSEITPPDCWRLCGGRNRAGRSIRPTVFCKHADRFFALRSQPDALIETQRRIYRAHCKP